MGSESLTREQEDLEVRGGFGIANPFGHSLPTAIPGKLLRQSQNLVIVELILSSPILFTAGIHFRWFFYTTKVYPDSLNLLNAGDSFPGISPLTSYICFPEPGT
jgi:hypothetical protein